MVRRREELLALLAGLAGCLNPAEERVHRDFDEVGRARLGEVEVSIDPGTVLAATAGSPLEIVSRASAPVVEVHVSGGEPGTALRIRIENLPVDAAVVGEGILDVEAPSALVRTVSVTSPASIRVAPSAADTPRAIRFGYVSDLHVNTDSVEAMVAEVSADPIIELVLSGGDLVDKGSTGGQWDTMTAALAALPVPFYSTVGNHEVNGDDGEEYHRRLGRMSYAFDLHGVRVALADSANATLASRVFDFVEDALSADGASMRIFVTHVPPFDSSGLRSGGFSSRLEAEKLLAMLAGNRVDLTLYGHIHALEVFENAGIPAYIGGGGGGHDNVFDDVGYYFLVITVDPLARTIEVEIREL